MTSPPICRGLGRFSTCLGGQLFIKGVVGYARAFFQPSDSAFTTWTNDMYSGRIQLMYLY